VTWLSVLKNPKIIGGIALILLSLYLYNQFKGALENKYDAGYKAAELKYEAEKAKAQEEAISTHNEAVNVVERSEIASEAVLNESRSETREIINETINDCGNGAIDDLSRLYVEQASSANTKLQALFDSVPTNP